MFENKKTRLTSIEPPGWQSTLMWNSGEDDEQQSDVKVDVKNEENRIVALIQKDVNQKIRAMDFGLASGWGNQVRVLSLGFTLVCACMNGLGRQGGKYLGHTYLAPCPETH